jgi:hypothetical protein
MKRDRRLYGPNDLVSSDRVAAHVRYLQTFGMGPKTIGKHARVAKTSLREILYNGRRHIRRRSEARVLAVQPTLDTLPRNVKVPATETLQRIKQLTLWGYPKALISREALGNKCPALQTHSLRGKTSAVTVRTAVRIRNFHARIVAMRRLWQEKRGPIPERHYVYWKSTTNNVRALGLRPFAVTYDLNYVWPKEPKVNRMVRKPRKEKKTKKIFEQRRQLPATPSKGLSTGRHLGATKHA